MRLLPLGRRGFLGFAALAALALPMRRLTAAPPAIEVRKSPSCGCCALWVEHLEAAGFEATVIETDDLAAFKQEVGVPGHLAACHTALIGGYVIEGHVPAAALTRLLDERPAILGLAVPGMPAGSPGMPDPNPERYDVIGFGVDEHVFMSFVATDPV